MAADSSTVALIVDLQVDFFAHERLTRHRAVLADRTNALTAAARLACVPVVWIKQQFAQDLSDAPLEFKKTGRRVVIAGTPGASLLPELKVTASDRILVKKRYSAFFATGLDDLLTQLGCTQLIVAGINTHACVRSSVVDAYQRDYDILLARDCIDSHDEQHHEISWRYMDGRLGRGMSNEGIVAALQSELKA
jgi:nicotinamidase-related amidase